MSLKAEAEKFIGNAKENSFGWSLKSNSTDEKIVVIVDNEADADDNPYFTIAKNGDSFVSILDEFDRIDDGHRKSQVNIIYWKKSEMSSLLNS